MKPLSLAPLAARALAVLLLTQPVLAQNADHPDTQATTDILSRSEIIPLMTKVCDYQTSLCTGTGRNDWIRGAFYTGVMATYRVTGDEKYLNQALQWGQEANFTPNPKDDRHADNQCCGQTYCELALAKNDPKLAEPYRAAIDRMMASPKRGRQDWWWCDSLYMAPPALARLAQVTNDPKYTRFMNEMYWDTTDFLFDKSEGFFYRDANYFNKPTKNGKKIFWARGNGWVMGGLARTIECLPEKDPSRARFIELFRQMADSLARTQGKDGLWRSSLLDPEEFPMPEASGTAFFCYALTWGVNQGILDRGKFLPVATNAWKGLCSVVSPEGRVGYVQQVAGAPGPSTPEGTHEYAAGAFLLAASEILKLHDYHFDFGTAGTQHGYATVSNKRTYSPEHGWGWLSAPKDLELRDRKGPDPLRRDYVFGHSPATFRVDLPPGTYRVTLTMGDMQYGNHVLQPSVDVEGVKLPELRAEARQFATLTTAFRVAKDSLQFNFSSPENNWVLNALTIESASKAEEAKITTERFKAVKAELSDSWTSMSQLPNPIAVHLNRFKENLAKASVPAPTGLTRQDYLKIIAGDVDYFKTLQNEQGAIIDPHKKEEWQYSTPCFALAAATLVVHADRKDLLEPAAKAMDWATHCLKLRKGATAHEDFYPPQLAHALPLLKPLVAPERASRWEADLKAFDPFEIYRSAPGHGNWNVVALSGEYLFSKLGIRNNTSFVETCLAAQGSAFNFPYGMYCEVHMPYDHFPRLWAADMMAAGYQGKHAADLQEALDRAALTSLFMQSPTGELPAGGRSTHHQWNEAEQCVTYEIYANKAMQQGDTQLAGVYKRAARLALSSMKRWVRPSGEMWIVKNRFEPGLRHGYDGYSAHSQYNLLPMAMLSIAYAHAEATEQVAEKPTPAEVGGFVLDIRPTFHKVFANAGGTYVEVDTCGDPHYNPTGLLRVHQKGCDPQLGPSDGLVTQSAYSVTTCSRTTAAVGVAWKDLNGNWRRLAECDASALTRCSLLGEEQQPDKAGFQLVYQGYFSGPSFISEHYSVTPGQVEVTTELPDYEGPTRLVWPVLADNGQQKPQIQVEGTTVSVSLGSSSETFCAVGAKSVRVEEELYGYRNGLARLAVAEYPEGVKPQLRMTPR